MAKITNTYNGKIDNDVSPAERRLIALINGAKPETPEEEQMVKEIEEAKKKGQVIYIPSN